MVGTMWVAYNSPIQWILENKQVMLVANIFLMSKPFISQAHEEFMEN